MTRYEFAFLHGTKVVWFGPHETADHARESFQVRYGYWPMAFLNSRVWK